MKTWSEINVAAEMRESKLMKMDWRSSYKKEAETRFDFPNRRTDICEGFFLVDMGVHSLEEFKELFEMKYYGGRLKKGTMNYEYNSFYNDQGHGRGAFGWEVAKASHSKKFSELLPKYGMFANFYAYWGFPRHIGVDALKADSIQLEIEVTESSRGFYDIRCTISRAWQREQMQKYTKLVKLGRFNNVFSISFEDLKKLIEN